MKKFSNVLIASDIDGTLLWDAHYVNPRNCEKLRYFCDNGGHFSLSTGRNHTDIFPIMEAVGNYVNMPCILCNGSYLYDTTTKAVLNPQYLASEPLVSLLEMIRRDYDGRVGFRASFDQGFLICEGDKEILVRLRHYGLAHLAIPRPFEDFGKEKLYKAVLISSPALLTEVRTRLKPYENAFTITTSDPYILEIQPKGISKSFQFPYLKSLYDGAELWCIGDYNNDLEMLRNADVAVCPQNAVPEIKAIAHHEVCHCRDGALADMIDLIEKSIDKRKPQ